MMQLISEQWRNMKSVKADSAVKKHFIDSRGPSPKKDLSPPHTQERKSGGGEELVNELLDISSSHKYEEALPPLNDSKKVTAEKEVLLDITVEDMNTSRLGPPLTITLGSVHDSDKKLDKEDSSSSNVADNNPQALPEVPEPESKHEDSFSSLSLKDNVRVVSKPTRNHSLEMIQEIDSELGNSNSQVSGRFTKRGVAQKQQEKYSSFFTARGQSKDLAISDCRRKVKSSRGSYVENPMFELKDLGKEATLEKIQEAAETPVAQKPESQSAVHPYKMGSGSINYTTLRSRQHIIPQSNYDSFSGLSQSLCKRQTAGDSLVLSAAGLLSGTPYAENSEMCHSFMNKPVCPELGKHVASNFFFTNNKKVSTLKENKGIIGGLNMARAKISVKRVHIKKC